MERNPIPAMNLRMIEKIYKHDDRLTQFASMTYTISTLIAGSRFSGGQ